MNSEVQQGAPRPDDVADCVPVTRMNAVLCASAVVVGLMARMALIFIWHTYRNDPAAYQPQWFGAETGSIARSIAQGHGFSSPFGGETGPTAWIGPIYPYLCAAVFKTFGIFGERSAQVILSINSLVSALTCIPIYFLGRRVFSRSVGLIACWSWAVVPFFMRWPTTWVWDMAFTALLVVCLLLQANADQRAHQCPSFRRRRF